MTHVQSPPRPESVAVPLATSVHRDLEVGRYDHVQQGAPWLRDLALEAARVAEVPIVAINLMKSTTQRTVAAVGVEVTLQARQHTLCHAIIDEGRTVHVADASADPRWAANPFVDGRWGRVRFYGSHPLVSPSGLVVGTLCVLDDHPRELAPAQVDALDALAARVVAELEESRLAALKAGVRRWSRTVA
ncbi:hypothetical protein ASG49_14285 [Marmoricola sp. Leaf446]|uniref:GAF domain-containing protein n=1 Tax=Marmoricola sp. Leaf446 TaxID=1736379 RepID=UPI0006F3AD46|nr:GAF domain-containing protein [Marmoricola sp. Leaf446]KQT90889.1 hypothetical protein ASG49_14285 [Marmoricola sp. Leaf446]